MGVEEEDGEALEEKLQGAISSQTSVLTNAWPSRVRRMAVGWERALWGHSGVRALAERG